MTETPWPDETILRVGEPSDVDRMLDLKARLSMSPDESGDEGGFLLGSSGDEYEELAEADRVLLMEVGEALAGMAVSLDDPTFRNSDLWARKERVEWGDFSPEPIIESSRIGYFDQLAVAPEFQGDYYGAALALATVQRLFESDHEFVLATTVVEPVLNRAALPLVDKVRGMSIGELEEEYPEVGTIKSRLHILERETFRSAIADLAEAGTDIERATVAAVHAKLGIDAPTRST